MKSPRPALLLLVASALACVLLACKPGAQVPPGADAAPAPDTGPISNVVESQAENTLDRFEWPALHVTTVTGEPFDLAEHRGRWVVVNFWATWCAPCLKEMPELSGLHARRGDINVVGLAYEEIDAEDLRAFLAARPVTYPVAMIDVDNPPPDFATPRGLPTTYLIDHEGQLARQFLGPVSAAEIEAVVAAARK